MYGVFSITNKDKQVGNNNIRRIFLSNQIVHKISFSFRFWAPDYLIDFSKIYRLKGLEPKNKDQTKSHERFDLTKKYI